MAAARDTGIVRVDVQPRVCLHDASTSIRVTGLAHNSPITLTLTTKNDEGLKYHSYAHYMSDASGTVDVEQSEALGGSFTGVFPAGLFSSLREYPFNYTRLQKEDSSKPWLMTLKVHENHLTLEQSVESVGKASTVLERHIMGPGVRREPIIHERVRGKVFYPAGPGPHPAIIDIFGGFGGLKEYRASMLASRGFACLALAYFNYSDLPKLIETLDLEYLEAAVEYILQQPGVIPDRCGVLCSSKGGNLGLAMGIHLPKVTAVVSVGGILIGDMTITFREKELWKATKIESSFFFLEENNIYKVPEDDVKKIALYNHPNIPPCETAPDDTHFLLLAGDNDCTHSYMFVDALAYRMKLYGREKYCHTVIYPGAGHIIEPPYNTFAMYSKYDLMSPPIKIEWGGNALGTCQAQEDNWKNMRKFFQMHIQERSVWYQQYMMKLHEEIDGKL